MATSPEHLPCSFVWFENFVFEIRQLLSAIINHCRLVVCLWLACSVRSTMDIMQMPFHRCERSKSCQVMKLIVSCEFRVVRKIRTEIATLVKSTKCARDRPQLHTAQPVTQRTTKKAFPFHLTLHHEVTITNSFGTITGLAKCDASFWFSACLFFVCDARLGPAAASPKMVSWKRTIYSHQTKIDCHVVNHIWSDQMALSYEKKSNWERTTWKRREGNGGGGLARQFVYANLNGSSVI